MALSLLVLAWGGCEPLLHGRSDGAGLAALLLLLLLAASLRALCPAQPFPGLPRLLCPNPRSHRGLKAWRDGYHPVLLQSISYCLPCIVFAYSGADLCLDFPLYGTIPNAFCQNQPHFVSSCEGHPVFGASCTWCLPRSPGTPQARACSAASSAQAERNVRAKVRKLQQGGLL